MQPGLWTGPCTGKMNLNEVYLGLSNGLIELEGP